MAIDLDFCVDVSKNKFLLLGEIARGGQGAVYRTQYPNTVVKLELDDGKLIPANDEARKKFQAVMTLPIPQNSNVTLPMNILEKFSGYTMRMMDDMTSFLDAFGGAVDEEPLDNPWLESIAQDNPQLAMIFFKLIKRGGLRRFFRAYLYAAHILSKIHGAGLVYCDFSHRNIFISKDLNFCHVWLIDADNLDFQRNTRRKCFYTPHIGAPELHDGSGGCTFYSDAFAFASTLFQQLTNHHPFDGAAFDEKLDELELEEAEIYRDCGGFPWVFDSEDDSNFWEDGGLFTEFLPPAIMDLLDKTFGVEDGLFNITKRPSLIEWSFALAETLDGIIRCPHCKMDRHGNAEKCSWCDAEHAVVTMHATFMTGGKLWDYAHEISQGTTIEIPMRLVHGYREAELDEPAFKFVWKDKRFELVRVGEKFSAEFEDATTPRMRAAGFETSADNFTVYCTDRDNFVSKIEVRILNANK